jgi:hypothetical protein
LIPPSSIYIASCLTATVRGADFLKGGEFPDCRLELDVERGRDLFYCEENESEGWLRPWMTPLCLLGNHIECMVYDAGSNVIWMTDQGAMGSFDQNVTDGYPEVPAEDWEEILNGKMTSKAWKREKI